MKESLSEFVMSLINGSAELRAAYLDEVTYWSPDDPPVTTLFARLGSAIVENFDSQSSEYNQGVFKTIESGMLSEDHELVTAVATGTVEAIVSRWSDRPGLKDEIQSLLGVRSRSHALAWSNS